MKWITHTHPAYGSTLRKLEGFVIPRKFLTESLGSEMIPWPYISVTLPLRFCCSLLLSLFPRIHRLGNLSSVMQPSKVFSCGIGGWRCVGLDNPSITASLIK